MNEIEALTDTPPAPTREAASAPEAAAFLLNPDAPEPISPAEHFIQALEREVNVCSSCGNNTQPAGTCAICPKVRNHHRMCIDHADL